MFMRLAFSTAVHTECDIFLIDEVLAVGDQPFRRKCLKRIEELRAEGRTTVYVSHNPKQVLKMCKRGIVLEDGGILFDGDAMGAIEALGYQLDFDDDDDDSAA
jgi:ABC-2 type transport system ATP-binding protein